MTCLDCSRHITRALEQVEGVASAQVDYRGGTAHVEVARPVPTDALLAAVERAGYRAKVASTADITLVPAPAVPSVAVPASMTLPPAMSRQAAGTSMRDEGDGVADFDVLIIGTGGAGVAAAIQAVGMGGKVAIVEAGTLGGTCVNVGCIPSKNLIEVAAHYHAARQGFQGIAPCAPELDWKAVIREKEALVTELRQAKYADVLASYPGLALLPGRARFVGGGGASGPVVVRVDDGATARDHRARKVVVATGTRPSAPNIPGLDQVGVLNSTTAMELEQLPTSMLVLGGSAVGLELAQTFARVGVKVTVLELIPRLLPLEDEAISDALEGYLRDEGIEIHTGIQTTSVERIEDDVVVHVAEGSLTGTFRAQRLLVATGRQPNTDDLAAESVGIALTARRFVQVDATMRTTNPDVFAAGDVTGGPGYVYVAAAGGRVAAENAMKSLAPSGTSSDEPTELDLSAVPGVTFTSPQVGSVGLTEAQAKALGHHTQVAVLRMDQVPRAFVSHDPRGLVKMVADVASGKLLGVHAVAATAGEFMGEAALAVRFGLTARDLMGTLHPYLTWSESMKLAAQGFTMDVSKLSCCA
jgi:mercuric reductase